MFKKLLAGLSVIALSLGIVALTAGPASAYVKSIDASCTALTVNLSGYSGEADNTVSVYVDGAVVVDGAAFGETYDTSVPFPQDGNAHTYRVVIVAHDGEDGSLDTGTVSVDPCVQENLQEEEQELEPEPQGGSTPEVQTLIIDEPPVIVVDKIRICHATSSEKNPYTNPEVSVRSIINLPNGHHYHEGDIIPPFHYELDDVVLHYDGKNWTEQNWLFWLNGCGSSPVTPMAPEFFDAECTDEGEVGLGGFIIFETDLVQFQMRYSASEDWVDVDPGTYYESVGTRILIRAVGLDDVELEGDTSWRYRVMGPDEPCGIVPTPPEFVDAYCDDQVRGGVVDGYFVVYATDGVYHTWKLNGEDQGVVPAEAYGNPIPVNVGDTVVIKAHAMDGYTLKHPREARWVHEFTLDDLCTLPTVEVDVDWTQPTCDADGSLTFETVDGEFYPGAVEWTVDGLPAAEGSYDIAGTRTVVLTATATEGYGFAGEEGSTLEWEIDFTDPRPCNLPTLALTGTDSSVLSGLGFGGAILLAGGLLVLARQRRALIHH